MPPGMPACSAFRNPPERLFLPRVTPVERFSERLARMETTQVQIGAALVVLFFVSVSGTVGYAYLEGWSLMDGVYMTFITLTTIGFEEVHPLSFRGRIFTVAIGTVGIVTIGFILTRTTQMLVARQRLRKRHMERMIARIKDHYVICGFGRIGTRIANVFQEAGQPFVVIDNAPQKLERLKKTNYLYVAGNAESEEALIEAGLNRAKGMITTLTEDSDNVFATLIARELRPDLMILARASTSENVRRLYRAGASKVVSPYEIGADRMARVILRPNVDHFLEQTALTGTFDLQMEEVRIEPGSSIEGQTLVEADFRNRFEAIVVGVVAGATEEVIFNPKASTRMNAGDTLVVLGNREMLERLVASCRA